MQFTAVKRFKGSGLKCEPFDWAKRCLFSQNVEPFSKISRFQLTACLKFKMAATKHSFFNSHGFWESPVKRKRLLVIRARSPSLINNEKVSSLLKETIEWSSFSSLKIKRKEKKGFSKISILLSIRMRLYINHGKQLKGLHVLKRFLITTITSC